MTQSTKLRFLPLSAVLLLMMPAGSVPSSAAAVAAPPAAQPKPAAQRNAEESQALVLLRGLPTLGTKHSIAIVELNPDAANFGAILQEFELPNLTIPLHHLYYSPNGRLYATCLDPKCSLAEISLSRNASGAAVIKGVKCLDTGGQQVGEDIVWHSVNGKEYMFVTFMGGTGVEQPDCGSVGVFDPQSNKLIKLIQARKSVVAKGAPYILYPHGLSAYQDRLVVSSTIHPDLATGVGNGITVIDLNTFEPIQNIVVEDAKPVGFPSSPVEVLFVRPSIVPGVAPAVLVNTMFGFETWKIPYSEANKSFGAPVKVYDGVKASTGVPLEFYGNQTELFVSHALPGIVKRYKLSSLPELVSSGPDIMTEAGSHHMIFFSTSSGRKVIAVQNNLLNLGNKADNDPTDVDFIAKVNAHSVTVHDLQTGERLAKLDFKGRYKKGVENIEALFGSGLYTTIDVFRLRLAAAATALLAGVLAVMATGGCKKHRRVATPLSDFSAPFVFGRFQTPADNPLTKESVELGRRLFYDPRLSANGKVSCSTCHIQRLAFTDGRTTSVGASGRPLAFNSMSLANLMWGPQRFFWNGRAATLEEQALIPLQHVDEMAQDLGRLVARLAADARYRKLFETAYGEISSSAIVRALASFERTLISSHSRYDQFLRGEITLDAQEELGRKLFMAHPDVKVSLRGANCIDCHSQFLSSGSSARYDGFSNNGLDDEAHLHPGLQAVTGNPAHRGMFKVPSLRNIALTAPYMHDGRFNTLEEVLDHYDRGIKNSSTLSALIVEADNRGAAAAGRISLHLTAGEKAAIIAFLHTLTDQEFVTAEPFSDPFACK